MKRIPITTARRVAQEYDATIVCIVAWDGKNGLQHVTTYGESKQECEWAADLGNQIKRKVLRWPEEECGAKPTKLKDDEEDRECETCGKLMRIPKGSNTTECSKCLDY